MKLVISNLLLMLLITVMSSGVQASKLTSIKVLDQDYLMIHFKDGDVKFVDDGTGSTAFSGHASDPDNSFVVTYGEPLNLDISADVGRCKNVSQEDS